METYGDIINRIIEILNYSKERKKEFSEDEIKDNFSKIMHSDIANECAEEFRELLNAEMVFYKMQYGKNIDLKNIALMEKCKERASISNEETDDYLELLGILRSAKGGNPLTLREQNGYYVLKSDYPEFLRLCRKLSVGVSEKLINIPKDEFSKELKSNLEDSKVQRKRIITAMENLRSEEKGEKEEVIEEPEKDETGNFFSSKRYKELIYLGITGNLTVNMVADIKHVVNEAEFEILLNELQIFKIFTPEQIEEIKRIASQKVIYIKDIDEFINYMILLDDLNMTTLKRVVTQLYGYENYHYFIDKMYQYGKISYDEYFESVKELLDGDRFKKVKYN